MSKNNTTLNLAEKTKRILLTILAVSFLTIVGATVWEMLLPDFSSSEGSAALDIQTYLDGKNQPTHPSVVDMGEEWNGWRYWMAYSPYPNANGGEENPCVAVSNDMLSWTTPEGLYNPIAFNENTACDELKDPHILYNEDMDMLEVWYLGRIDSTIESGGTLLLFRKSSADGVHWSNYETVMDFSGYLSPSVSYIDQTYRVWAIRPSSADADSQGALVCMESPDGKNWTSAKACSFAGEICLPDIWHGAVSYDTIYRFVFIESSAGSSCILYAESTDGVDWSAPEVIVEKGNFWNGFYRPCILHSDGTYYCVYGVITQENEWYLSMSTGSSPDTLCGITAQDAGSSDINTALAKRSSPMYAVKKLYRSAQDFCRPELLVLGIVIAAVLSLLKCGTLPVTWSVTWLLSILRFSGRLRWMSVQELSLLICIAGCISLLCSTAVRGCVDRRKETKPQR